VEGPSNSIGRLFCCPYPIFPTISPVPERTYLTYLLQLVGKARFIHLNSALSREGEIFFFSGLFSFKLLQERVEMSIQKILLMWQVYFLLQKWKLSSNLFSLNTASKYILLLFFFSLVDQRLGPRLAERPCGVQSSAGTVLQPPQCREEWVMWDVSLPVQDDVSMLGEGNDVQEYPLFPRHLGVISAEL